jgi:hypothetical protein
MRTHSLIRTSAALLLMATAGMATVGVAAAGECAIEYVRTACPGKETESYSKCGGKQTCVQPEQTASAQACQEAGSLVLVRWG